MIGDFLQYGFNIHKHADIPLNSYVTMDNTVFMSPDSCVQLMYGLDKSTESIYSYWFGKRGVNKESVDDCICVAKSRLYSAIERNFTNL